MESTKPPPCFASLSCTHALTLHTCNTHVWEKAKAGTAAMCNMLFDLDYKQTHVFNLCLAVRTNRYIGAIVLTLNTNRHIGTVLCLTLNSNRYICTISLDLDHIQMHMYNILLTLNTNRYIGTKHFLTLYTNRYIGTIFLDLEYKQMHTHTACLTLNTNRCERGITNASSLNFPLIDFVLGLQMHHAPRRLQIINCCARAIQPFRLILPGCPRAISFTNALFKPSLSKLARGIRW